MFKMVSVLCLALGFSSASVAFPRPERVSQLKRQIFQMAQSFEGQGDPNQTLQRSLEVYVNQLLVENPMPPIADRIEVLAGTWKQIWGPYDYRNEEGGVDPTLGWREIYQVVSPEGFYYNVAPYLPDGDASREKIGLLRGEYKLDKNNPNGLKVRFKKYPGVNKRPENIEIWELPALEEAGHLPDRVTIVPTWVVRLFFGGGRLDEVYTDHDMRIVYGTSNRNGARRSLYVMKRVN